MADEENLAAQAVAPEKAARLTPQARRARAEADARRRDYAALEASLPPETGGRGGKEPVRYGDWEVKGIACDF